MQEQPPPPQWAPPPQQPGYGAPPPGMWGGPGYMAPPPRPIGVTIGGIWLILLGLLWVLAGAACAIGGGFIGSLGTAEGIPPELVGGLGGAFAIFGIVGLIIGVLQIAAGAGAFGGRGWARWIGIILSIIFVVFGILSVLSALGTMDQTGPSSLVFTLVFLIGYGFTAYAFMRAGAFFAARR